MKSNKRNDDATKRGTKYGEKKYNEWHKNCEKGNKYAKGGGGLKLTFKSHGWSTSAVYASQYN